MVKKLLKYDLKSVFRILLPAELTVIGISLLLRFVRIAENDSVGYSILFGSSLVFFVCSLIVCVVMSVILALVRFYKNMYTSEGYFTHTLPVKSGSHIFSKTLTAIVAEVSAFVTCIIALIIASCGTPLYNCLNTVDPIIKDIHSAVGGHFYPLIVEFIIAILVSAIANILLYYACLTLGQLVKKHRLLMSFVFFFIYTAIIQAVSTVISIIFSVAFPLFAEEIENFMTNHMMLSAHLGIWFTVLINAVLSAIFLLVTNTIISKKLNLE